MKADIGHFVINTPLAWPWYCLRAQPKREHIAAARLRHLANVDIFCPRLRVRRATRRGAVWFVDALFPGYLFAKFDLHERYRQVLHSPGVSDVLKFGQRFATIEEEAMQWLREQVGDSDTITVSRETKPGDEVQIMEGAFRGLEAVVLHVLPAKARVKVLLDFLGRKVEAEVQQPALSPKIAYPLTTFSVRCDG